MKNEQYALAEQRWIDLWHQIEPKARVGWLYPWFQPIPGLEDGNPIFSAVSPLQKRGIRIIQFESERETPEIACWLDDFAGEIDELVISLAISHFAIKAALSLMIPWMEGLPAPLDLCFRGKNE